MVKPCNESQRGRLAVSLTHIAVAIIHDVEVPNVDDPPKEQINVLHNMVTNE